MNVFGLIRRAISADYPTDKGVALAFFLVGFEAGMLGAAFSGLVGASWLTLLGTWVGTSTVAWALLFVARARNLSHARKANKADAGQN